MEPSPIIKEVYREAFSESRKARIRETDKRDSVFATVNSSSLVISVSFFTLSGFGTAVSDGLLVASWVLFLLALIVQLLSYVFVEWHFIQSEKRLNDWYSKGGVGPFPKEHGSWGIVTVSCNYASYVLTIVGLGIMVLFGWYNYKAMSLYTDDGKKFANPLVNNPPLPDNNQPGPKQEPPTSEPSK